MYTLLLNNRSPCRLPEALSLKSTAREPRCLAGIGALLPAVLLGICASFLSVPQALAQPADAPQPTVGHSAPYEPGDAIITKFPGVADGGTGTQASAAAGLLIDLQGTAAAVIRLAGAPGNGGTIFPPVVRAVTAAETGQVFPIAVMAPGNDVLFGATSRFGLHIGRADPNGGLINLKTGDPQAQWMPGQWGPGGSPGSIWRMDGATGNVTLFTNLPDSGPGIGGLVYAAANGHVYASSLDDGLIYSLDQGGSIAATFDHGVDGRPAAGEPPVPDDGTVTSITSVRFDVEYPGTWGFTAPARQVTALTVSQGRLYYAIASKLSIWSVSINPDGTFGQDPRKEIDVQSDFQSPVTSMLIVGGDTLYAAQRGPLAPALDYSGFAMPGQAQVLRFMRDPSTGQWSQQPESYAVGHTPEYNNATGGVALRCPLDGGPSGLGTLWSTIDGVRDREATPDLKHGLQGNDTELVRPANVPPTNALFAVTDPDLPYETAGFMGDVKILPCAPAFGALPPPAEVGVFPVCDWDDARCVPPCWPGSRDCRFHCWPGDRDCCRRDDRDCHKCRRDSPNYQECCHPGEPGCRKCRPDGPNYQECCHPGEPGCRKCNPDSANYQECCKPGQPGCRKCTPDSDNYQECCKPGQPGCRKCTPDSDNYQECCHPGEPRCRKTCQPGDPNCPPPPVPCNGPDCTGTPVPLVPVVPPVCIGRDCLPGAGIPPRCPDGQSFWGGRCIMLPCANGARRVNGACGLTVIPRGPVGRHAHVCANGGAWPRCAPAGVSSPSRYRSKYHGVTHRWNNGGRHPQTRGAPARLRYLNGNHHHHR
jgi:hypothetical protein